MQDPRHENDTGSQHFNQLILNFMCGSYFQLLFIFVSLFFKTIIIKQVKITKNM